MRCYQARRLISAHLDDEVDPHLRAALQSHLAGCAICSAELARLREQWEALVECDPPPPLPADLWRQVMRAVDEAKRAPWHRRHRARLLQAACVAGSVVLGFSGGAMLSWKRPAGEAGSSNLSIGERMLVAEAFDANAFGLSEGKEGWLQCVPK